ncbi:bifunctional [glutamate--ammonia ligase]-adenylyl-L-tyrosine phosphorylase/[glutamate--ammonia-ligase] adenylyltransferase [Sphingomicrobium clamense]|uniref:Bifunctional [glutamate--ammonia ligase]-adenylyl-L-tyrosine phosphorylase/[glutamate--ammonia-ligase] adenylyltransferase n=1 Tax=Sphingomicrobium clamense TaxID=2851013 RepID=A0ABS6V5F6_9SPHN|nr:bifunctional [glutamate--ammonia ligase]-adenylyl-L-tyrosine phosphorylase/[glutamate--ammonia-ligase] adenylyltransferase [Sphingomicrobium sp. B8]MBW0144427.1 bifunctional [glutamate--ammonia ligase]-adenylyl-L-tyrosine phosphorylase/[glutamate--ammonia-ligase] adenylyltransferase [Sphingomicrobium sp. B8]
MNRIGANRPEALERAKAHSPFLRRLCEQRESLVATFLEEGSEAAISEALDVRDEDVVRALRRQRGGLALTVALGDLAGELSLEEVTRHLSDFADRAIDQALAAALSERCEGAALQGISVISLGKLGSRELNYSSDVDLILIYDPDRLPVREGRDVAEEAVRIGQRFVKILQERTPDGYVVRVDLRLRPASEVTPIVLPVDAAISHYESQAMGWERAAFIRARVGGGDPVLGQRFLDAVQPFVWRRAIDFGAVEEIRAVGARIRAHYAEGQHFGPGYDLKRGRGGIREVEFYVQAQQLIHGGRAPELRVPATLDAIAALSVAGHFDETTATVLADAYRDLRTAEHRVQMIDDRQTHDIPEQAEALEQVAALAGASSEAWLGSLEPHTGRVGALFDDLAGDERRLPRDAAKLERTLDKLGFDDARSAARLIGEWRTGRARSLRSMPARRAFEAMLPGLVEAIAEAPHPNHALNRFADLVDRLPSGINIYRLLEARPDLAQQLALILSLAPALADQLARRPVLFDGLVDRSALGSPGSAADMAEALTEEMEPLDYDVALDRARRSINEKRFGVGVQLISGRVDPLEAARRYAVIAEGAVRALAARTVREFELIRGRFPEGGGLVILGLGRLGGEALTHASDLDIIFLYDVLSEGRSNGARPLGPGDYYNRLANRVSAALSVPTAAGPLYEVDTRLRPEGKNGPLAVSIDAFLDYQRNDAWTWEHMAMARARVVYGDPKSAATVMDGLHDILTAERDGEDTLEAVRAMRRQMREHKPPKGPHDLKLSEGGLVDLEFGVHARQLLAGDHFHPDLNKAVDALVGAGLAPDTLVEDHRLLTRALVAMRLVAPDDGQPSRAARGWLAKELNKQDWDSLLAALDAARQRVAEFWQSTGETT